MGLEQAREALNKGVEQADSSALSQNESDNNSESRTQEVSPGSNNQEAAKAIFELDKAEKFMFKGKEWTLKELEQSMQFQSDYTRKTQELAKERQFAENLSQDLENVFENPDLADEFKKIYPKKYHAALDRVLSTRERQDEYTGNKSGEASSLDQESIARLVEKAVQSKVAPIINTYTQRETAAIESKLEALAEKYSKQFKLADEDRVLAKAEKLHNEGTKLTDQVWEKLWKDDHETGKSRFDAYQKEQFEQQKNANSKNRDIAKGGGVPGSAPKRETFKEATERAIRELEGR